jgi:hypothetical protein
MNLNLFGSRRRVAGAAAVTAALLVPLGVFGAPALARSSGAGAAQYQYKVTICHHTHSMKHPMVTISVSSAAVAKHMLKHGDTLGACPSTAPTTTAPTTHEHGNGKGNDDNDEQGQSSVQHGQSGTDHGQSGSQHGQSGESHGNGKDH